MKKIDYEFLNEIIKVADEGGGKLKNSNESHNATGVTYLYDNALKEIFQYEAEPVNDLTGKYPAVAISFLSYIKSGLPLKVVLPFEREEMERKFTEKLPFIIRYCDKYKPTNVSLRVANSNLKNEMTKLLHGNMVDLISADENLISRVSGSESPDKNEGEILIDEHQYFKAYEKLVESFDALEPY